jgi:hypothetical protein
VRTGHLFWRRGVRHPRRQVDAIKRCRLFELSRWGRSPRSPDRRTVIASNPELQERAAYKRAALAAALTSALGKRGVPDLTASLAADLGARAFDRAFDRWIEPSSQQILTDLAHEELQALRTAATALG